MIFENLEPILFWIIAGLTAGSAIMTMISQNIVRAATWLLFSLGGTAGVFFLLGADFVGATQLLVYVGGTLVLVIFGVMLTAQGPFITMKTSAAEWAISMTVGVALYAVLAVSVMYPFFFPKTLDDGQKIASLQDAIAQSLPPTVKKYAPEKNLSATPEKSGYPDSIGIAFLGGGMGPAHEEKDPETGKERVVRTGYLLPFEIVSVHLLVVLIGAAYLARAKRRRGLRTAPHA